ncbi:hypothetical protein SASPL_120517 [Salvia splendens]|uniref:Uncharacterized protein n=1 Tax=Salvia splendens TaxID=180675 RepID=A0A4D8Y5N2_SALSN|nr:uncharacterized protein LOC121741265 isoform X1 [Salvia splendens]XP_042043919.1 uncharacterized protein LOC121789553 isoform X1 [Salvia splendens]KAG6384118.1 hypothetical protein SASPL_156084 [Salvia splendens]KAG6418314.1 hypothetical protein SASPL_120517 [Salvia splendens]
MANYCCSIELEPRTLKQGQLDHAREIAVDIVQTKEPDEASTMFTELQGLKDVVEIKEPAVVVTVSGENLQPQKVVEESGRGGAVFKEEVVTVETYCQCLVVESSPECRDIKEPLSAPF